ncbi:glutathione transferase [Ranunculus cassubicifolius]
MSKDEVILLDFWASPFTRNAIRQRTKCKGVEFKAQEENLLQSKSDLLLKSNPIYKKVPVLLHNGKAVNESSIIVSYIDDVWPTPALLPSCTLEKAQARFWADYIDKKVYDEGSKIWRGKGDVVEVAKKEFINTLKTLEGALGGKTYFGGDTFGFVDIILIPHYILVEDEVPKIAAWIQKCLEKESVSKFYPEPAKVVGLVGVLRKLYGIE